MTESQTRKAWMLGVGLSVMGWGGSPQHRGAAARLEYVAEQGMGGADAAEVRGNFDELAAMRVELSRRHVDFSPPGATAASSTVSPLS